MRLLLNEGTNPSVIKRKPTRKRKSRDRVLLEALLRVCEIDDNRLDGKGLLYCGRRVMVSNRTESQLIAIKEAMKGGAK